MTIAEAPPGAYTVIDDNVFSEYELDPSFIPPEDKPLTTYLAEILHELRTLRYQQRDILERLDRLEEK